MIDFNLYLVTDRLKIHNDLREAVRQALEGGVRAVQLREKDLPIRQLLTLASDLRHLTQDHGARLFINDRVDVAMAVAADGVHLGQKGLRVDTVRQVVGSSLLIGVSTHTMEEARLSEEGGADFITVGPIYDTPSKRMYGPPIGTKTLNKIAKTVSIPVFAIGGIGHEQVQEVLSAGAFGVSVISSILCAESIPGAARWMASELHKCRSQVS
jgi:thiamine-phosphate pyrophosphorylase